MARLAHLQALSSRHSNPPGQSLIVTAAGKPELIVTKAARRPHKTAVQLRREARAMLTKPGNKVDAVALLRELRK